MATMALFAGSVFSDNAKICAMRLSDPVKKDFAESVI